MACVIAMQKVVGSNPISRFFGNALHVGGLRLAGESRINWNHPRISSAFRELIQISSRNRPDAWRIAPIAVTARTRPSPSTARSGVILRSVADMDRSFGHLVERDRAHVMP
jgi:hypothetical protein